MQCYCSSLCFSVHLYLLWHGYLSFYPTSVCFQYITPLWLLYLTILRCCMYLHATPALPECILLRYCPFSLRVPITSHLHIAVTLNLSVTVMLYQFDTASVPPTSLLLSYYHTIILSYYYTIILSYYQTIIPLFLPHSAFMLQRTSFLHYVTPLRDCTCT